MLQSWHQTSIAHVFSLFQDPMHSSHSQPALNQDKRHGVMVMVCTLSPSLSLDCPVANVNMPSSFVAFGTCAVVNISDALVEMHSCALPFWTLHPYLYSMTAAEQELSQDFWSWSQVMEGYDALYGRPGPAMQKKMRQVAHKILAMDSWATYLRMLGLPVAGDVDAFMTRRLRLAWHNSLQKRYHSKVSAAQSRMLLSRETQIILQQSARLWHAPCQ